MKNLLALAGLPVTLQDDGHLTISADLRGGDFSKRLLLDLAKVLARSISVGRVDTSGVGPDSREVGAGDRELYYMYRDVHQAQDEMKICDNHLRYDMTVILPGKIGKEYTKTLGHYHPDKGNLKISYPEVYEVISGRAFYLLQKPKRIETGFDFSEIVEAYLVEVKAGEKAIMPPDFGHITINMDTEPLVMSNWVSNSFKSDYTEIINHKGASHYIYVSDGTFKVENNKNYSKVPELKILRPKAQPEFALEFGKPMYKTAIAEVEKLAYLDNPEKYQDQLKPNKLFA